MRVLIMAPVPPPYGGIGTWLQHMIKANMKHGWSVDVVDESPIGKRSIFGDHSGRHYGAEFIRSLRIWRQLIGKIRYKGVKVVHCNISASFFGMGRELISCLITRIYNKPFIIHYRCTLPNTICDTKTLYMFKLLTHFSHGVIVLNQQSADYVATHVKKTSMVIPNFICKEYVVKKHIIHKEIKKVLYVGGVVKAKGAGEIIELSRRFLEIQFVLIGTAHSDILGMPHFENVVFMGEQNHETVLKELSDCDVFLFPSHFKGEGFSNALLEAMAMGLPCIATDWASASDMLENKGGILIEPEDVDDFEKALNDMSEANLRTQMSEWNIKKVLTNYIEDVVVDQYVDFYESILRRW